MSVTAKVKIISDTGSKIVTEYTDGIEVKEVLVHTHQISEEKNFNDAEDALLAIMKHEIKKANATTIEEIKFVIENTECYL